MILDRMHLFCIRPKRVKGDFKYFISFRFTEKGTESSARRGQPLIISGSTSPGKVVLDIF